MSNNAKILASNVAREEDVGQTSRGEPEGSKDAEEKAPAPERENLHPFPQKLSQGVSDHARPRLGANKQPPPHKTEPA